MKKVKYLLVALVAAFFVGAVASPAYAAKGDRGTDQSVYQGASGRVGYGDEKFMFSQVGGYYNGRFVPHWTYNSQVNTALARGQRAHTYIYAQFSGRAQADQMLNYYLPRVTTPKGSIVALDVESGWPDTDSVMYALGRIKEAGYTPVLYGYKNFLLNHLNLQYIASQYPLWLAEYPDYSVRRYPNYNFFPSFNNIAIFQFTSTYVWGGLDGDVDLTGITDNGYTRNTTPRVTKPAQTPVINGRRQSAGSYVVKPGDSWWAIANSHGLSMYQLAAINGRSINSVIHPGDVLKLTGQAPAVQRQSRGAWRDALGDTWHHENGTLTLSTWVNLRWGARTTSSRIATLAPGSTVKYDAWSRHGGYVWIRQPRAAGGYAYLAARQSWNGVPYGVFR